jgi:hypothetical protein
MSVNPPPKGPDKPDTAFSVTLDDENQVSSLWLKIRKPFSFLLKKFRKESSENNSVPKKEEHVKTEEWEKTKNLIELSETLEKRIQFESSWIGQRMNWLVISQSFLFTAFVSSASKTTIFTVKNTSENATDSERDLVLIIPAIITTLGLIQAFSAFVSILSAKSVNKKQAKLRGKIDNWIREKCHPRVLFTSWPILGKNRLTYHFGAFASWMIPVSLIVAWGLLLAYLVFPELRPILDFSNVRFGGAR